MGSSDVEENGDSMGSQKIRRPYLMIFLLSLLISTAGASVLGGWLCKFHPTNRQLWMVPLGLILFLTPLTIWFFLVISDLCISKKKEEDLGVNQGFHPMVIPSVTQRDDQRSKV